MFLVKARYSNYQNADICSVQNDTVGGSEILILVCPRLLLVIFLPLKGNARKSILFAVVDGLIGYPALLLGCPSQPLDKSSWTLEGTMTPQYAFIARILPSSLLYFRFAS